ncbi:4a-hydroxytetrahydrobiopterin dehydratase [Frankia sp. AgPm24]|uniref:Putative pterin-4-alpha-carbinolamine dehydratase n=1 Tax=Frankia umida TaxID=573489 RepID=A0ABT0JWG2_9ACTN|nr:MULTISPECIES: 4a-hydroxytetrahydrobiopterin dehydratase [Frankia]MCK9875664.1 4a-hydroxytetrahydrobiopterin dehydratase [Frankia umida]MCK9925057.1 4a-hydroxytetrahydrobiopterin dehydratase [Frankia sp. AgPm24]
MPTKQTRLDNAEVADALAALPGWLGDADRIQLEIIVDGDEADAISTEVLRAADELDHHPVIDRGPGTLTFTVWTHSVGGVTDLDVTLARRISHLLSSAGIAY